MEPFYWHRELKFDRAYFESVDTEDEPHKMWNVAVYYCEDQTIAITTYTFKESRAHESKESIVFEKTEIARSNIADATRAAIKKFDDFKKIDHSPQKS